ncbi:DUF302 domain-containing protein [Cryobacterium tagatosivorans]|uniref:DUF302 domain-containing protein n=1 Tax=Cryobacterium tagatosivorans TaxID=1259199 RepID=A0A4R8UKX8_9MICO|nr:DUF302 domain-containing protein [Cryobacterium tagatosivorans]TFB56684.1 DUF302 domain-containing protein [Cryobacterium tagatosivorans]
MTYANTISLSRPFAETVGLVKESLGAQGFGILTEIDVSATFTAKLGAEAGESVGDYLILGACNPPLAQRAIAADPDMGVLLPCNVVVRRGRGSSETLVQAIDPATMVQLSGRPGMQAIADEVGARLGAALAAVEAAEGC